MKPCKEKLADGKPCPNRVDEGQEYCFHHLASQDAALKKNMLSNAKIFFGAVSIALLNKSVASFLSKKQ